MRRKMLLAAVLGVVVLALIVWQASTSQPAPAEQAKPAAKAPANPLPIKFVVLFNTGVGYFQREGEVEGTTRVQLTFPADDINDLLKSLVLQDQGGRISSVNYDSHDPIDKILRSFALDLNNNPTFGQILNQARGEQIEVLRPDKKDGPPAKITGTIVGMEVQRRPAGKDGASEVEILNLSGPQGLQSLPLTQVLGVRFLNPVLESEFRRALQVLASSHDTQKKTVSLGFTGPGKRPVKVGYVVERPIWKTSYRLRLDANGKLFLQGWGLVENTSDDDWSDVRMVLVSGRPISYKMNLYEPLYLPRPTVEPELFASLRPPLYGGALMAGLEENKPGKGEGQGPGAFGVASGGIPGWRSPRPQAYNQFLGGGLNQMGGVGQGGFGQGGFGQGGGQGGFGQSGGNLGNLGGGMGMGGMNMGMIGGGGFGQTGNPPSSWNLYQGNQLGQAPGNFAPNRLSYEELQRRRQQLREERDKARKIGSAVTGLNFQEGIASVASAEEVGDYYQYVIEQKVTLPRQKSAMLPIFNQTIDGTKVSIFNETVHARYPLLGLRLKNTSGMPLTQGPITVFDGESYAGDTRILDVQPGEVRLLSYALDQGTEVKTQTKTSQSPQMTAKISGNSLTAYYKIRETKTYLVKNRSRHDRLMILEHPLRAVWNLIAPSQPAERTRSLYRFEVAAPAGKLVRFDVVEEQEQVQQIALQSPANRFLLGHGLEIQPVTKTILGERLELRVVKNALYARHLARESKTYFVQNQSGQERVFEVEHLVRPGWRLAGQKEGPTAVRFKLTVPAGKTASHEVVEEQMRVDHFDLYTPEDRPARYVLGLGIEVQPIAATTPEQLINLKIDKGVLKGQYKIRHTQRYFIKNNAEKGRVFAVDHLVRPDWKRLGPEGDIQAGPSIFRFELKVPAGSTASQEIVEERTYLDKDLPLKDAGERAVQEFLASPVPGAPVKEALAKVLAMTAKLAESNRQRAETTSRLRTVMDDQARLRANLAIVPQSAEPYKKFLAKLVAQESEIDNLQRQLRELQISAQQQKKEYETYVAGLQAE